jgi:putative addiction module CopG family antidote
MEQGPMPTRNISLTPEQDSFIDEMLKSGEYRNASEAVRDAIRTLQQRRAIDALKLERLRQSIDAGLADLDRGEFSEVGDEGLDAVLDDLAEPARSAERILGQRRDEFLALCRRYHVHRLELFGSAATGEDRPSESDLDFLVEFETLPPASYADTYFGLMEGLEQLFGRPVDLVVASAVRNPYFRASVERTKALLYAA